MPYLKKGENVCSNFRDIRLYVSVSILSVAKGDGDHLTESLSGYRVNYEMKDNLHSNSNSRIIPDLKRNYLINFVMIMAFVTAKHQRLDASKHSCKSLNILIQLHDSPVSRVKMIWKYTYAFHIENSVELGNFRMSSLIFRRTRPNGNILQLQAAKSHTKFTLNQVRELLSANVTALVTH